MKTFNPKLIAEYIIVLNSRGSRGLHLCYCYGKFLSNSEKDELLICLRIAKHNTGE